MSRKSECLYQRDRLGLRANAGFDYRDAATITGELSVGLSAITMLAQKKLNAAAAEIKLIVGILRIFYFSNIVFICNAVARGRMEIISKAMSDNYQRSPHLAVGKDEFVAV